MDIKTRILRWEHRMGENPAEVVMWIIGVLALIFLIVVFVDAYRNKKRNRRRRS